MAKKDEAKTGTAKRASAGGSDECKAYKLVRTALDSVQYTAINYYVGGGSVTEKKRRAAQISSIMKAAIDEIDKSLQVESKCPDGGHLCDGFCVPYQCP